MMLSCLIHRLHKTIETKYINFDIARLVSNFLRYKLLPANFNQRVPTIRRSIDAQDCQTLVGQANNFFPFLTCTLLGIYHVPHGHFHGTVLKITSDKKQKKDEKESPGYSYRCCLSWEPFIIFGGMMTNSHSIILLVGFKAGRRFFRILTALCAAQSWQMCLKK